MPLLCCSVPGPGSTFSSSAVSYAGNYCTVVMKGHSVIGFQRKFYSRRRPVLSLYCRFKCHTLATGASGGNGSDAEARERGNPNCGTVQLALGPRSIPPRLSQLCS